MKMFLHVVLLFYIVQLSWFASATLPSQQQLKRPLQRLAFGSCNKHDFPQPFWPAIAATQPDLWAWLGDVVYSDDRKFFAYFVPSALPEVAAKLQAQKELPGYKNFSAQVPIVGIWDDHDSCSNNGGIECTQRRDQQPLFLDFVSEPADSPRRHLPDRAIYASYTFGDGSDRQAKLILLDNRSQRGEPLHGPMLGDDQWHWLEHELATSQARIHLIGSGIQFTPVDKLLQEKWRSHPGEFERLIDLLVKYQTPGVILLSGDVHWSEMFRENCTRLGYPLYELTSSGLTHSCLTQAPFKSCHLLLNTVFAERYRMRGEWSHRELIEQYSQRRTSLSSISSSSPSTPTTASSSTSFTPAASPSLPSARPPLEQNASWSPYFSDLDWAARYDAQSEFVFGDMNFGLVEIDWDVGLVSLQARRAHDGLIMFEEVIPFSELTPSASSSSAPSDQAQQNVDAFCARPISPIRLWPAERFLPAIYFAIIASFALVAAVTMKLLLWIMRGVFKSCRSVPESKSKLA